MVQRRQGPLNLGVPNPVNVNPQQGATYRPQLQSFGRHSGRAAPLGPDAARANQVREEQSRTMAINGLLQTGQQLMAQKFQDNVQAAYQAGAAAAATGVAIEEMEVNPFMRTFARAGYKNLDAAKARAEYAQEGRRFVDSTGKAMDPEDFFNEFVAPKQAAMLEAAQQLNSVDRARAVRDSVEVNDAVIQYQAGAYQKHLMDQVIQESHMDGNSHLRDLASASSSDAPNRDTQVIGASMRAAGYVQDLIEPPEGSSLSLLPFEARSAMATSFISAMVEQDMREVPEQILDSGLLDALPFKERENITEALRSSTNRTIAVDRAGQYQREVEFLTATKAGRTSMQDVQAEEQRILQRGGSESDVEKVWNAYYNRKQGPQITDLVGALSSPTMMQDFYAMGSSPKAATTSITTHLLEQGVPQHEVFKQSLAIGLRTGYMDERVSHSVEAAIRRVWAADPDASPVSAEDSLLIREAATSLAQIQASNPAMFAVVASNMSSDAAGPLTKMVMAAQEGTDPVTTLQQYHLRANDLAAKSPPELRKLAQEHKELLDEQYKAPWYRRFVLKMLPGRDKVNRSMDNIVAGEMSAAMDRIGSREDSMLLSADEVANLAAADVHQRTLMVNTTPGASSWNNNLTPLVVPPTRQGQPQNPVDYFGVGSVEYKGTDITFDRSEAQTVLSEAIYSTYVKDNPFPKGETLFQPIGPDLMVVYRDPENPANTITLPMDRDAIRQDASSRLLGRYEEARKDHGTNVKVGIYDVRVHGANAVRSMTERSARLMRTDIVKALGDDPDQLTERLGTRASADGSPEKFHDDTDKAFRLGFDLVTDYGLPDQAGHMSAALGGAYYLSKDREAVADLAGHLAVIQAQHQQTAPVMAPGALSPANRPPRRTLQGTVFAERYPQYAETIERSLNR